VGNTGAALRAVGLHLGQQLGHAGRAARTHQTAIGVDGQATGVISAVLQPLQALNQNRNDVAAGNRTDDATHDEAFDQRATDRKPRKASAFADSELHQKKYDFNLILFFIKYFIN
jgi:hypothetical protein